ncbi:MAG TPA: hypothetical protein VF532_14350 [Candidatus Angelobacter sp.]
MSSLNASAGSALWLVFPALLLAYYLVCWLLLGRDPAIENVAPQYQPPPGVSPGMARYIVTGGSDGTTLAAVLAQLAARGVVAIQPEAGSYRIKLLRVDVAVQPEEAALVEALLRQKIPVLEPDASANPDAPPADTVTHELREAVQRIPEQQLASRGLAIAAQLAMSPHEAVINPRTGVEIKAAVDAIQDAFRKNFQDIYFRWNYGYVLAGVAATFLFGLGSSFFVRSEQAPSLFMTLWLLVFTSIAGVVMSGFFTARPRRPSLRQHVSSLLLPLLFIVFPGFMIAFFVMPQAKLFVLALLLAVALNSMFFVLMRAPTPAGRRALEQLAGFREFLLRVEQDRLERMNTPQEKAELLNRFLPYAIALEVKEGWGDTMASDFSNTIVER